MIRLDRPPVNAVNDAMHAEIRAAADFRVVGESALVGLPEITLGVLPGAGGTQRLPRRIGVTKAEEMIFSGS